MPSSDPRGVLTLARKLLALAVPTLLVLAGVEGQVRAIGNSLSQKKALLDRRAAKTDVLVLGSSQAFQGINPERISDSATSAAGLSQSLRCDEGIAALYLDRMPRLRAVVVSLAYFSLRYRLEQAEPWREFFYRHYFQIGEETPVRRRWHPRHFLFIANYGGRQTLDLLLGDAASELRIDEQGWLQTDFSKCGVVELTEAGGAARVARHTRAMRDSALAENVRGLDEFMATLRGRGIDVFLVTTPVFRTYAMHMDEGIRLELVDVAGRLAEKHRSTFRDYLVDPRFTLDDFADYDHLCTSGAEKFSDLLRTEVLNKSGR